MVRVDANRLCSDANVIGLNDLEKQEIEEVVGWRTDKFREPVS